MAIVGISFHFSSGVGLQYSHAVCYDTAIQRCGSAYWAFVLLVRMSEV